MSTVALFAKRMDERELLAKLAQNRADQIAELDELVEMHATGEGRLEQESERIGEMVEDICKGHALGTHGSTREALVRIRNHMRQLRFWQEKHERLVSLCMNAERLSDSIMHASEAQKICSEVDTIKAEEMPF